jgi:hypothetical protein
MKKFTSIIDFWISLSYQPREPPPEPPLPNVAPPVVPPNVAPPVVPPNLVPAVVPPSVPAAAAIVLLKSFTFVVLAEVTVTVYVAMNGERPTSARALPVNGTEFEVLEEPTRAVAIAPLPVGEGEIAIDPNVLGIGVLAFTFTWFHT